MPFIYKISGKLPELAGDCPKLPVWQMAHLPEYTSQADLRLPVLLEFGKDAAHPPEAIWELCRHEAIPGWFRPYSSV